MHLSRSVIRRLWLVTRVVAMLGSIGYSQESRLFPDWFTEDDAPAWKTSHFELDARQKSNLETVARRDLGRTCATYEGLRWDLVDPDYFYGAPLVELGFYVLMEEQQGGFKFIDVNLEAIYGVTNDSEYVFFWGAPWGVWRLDGIHVVFQACKTEPR